MNKIIQLNPDEFKTLIDFMKSHREFFRALIIFLSHFLSSSEVIKLLEIKQSTYYDRITRYKIEKEKIKRYMLLEQRKRQRVGSFTGYLRGKELKNLFSF